MSKEQIILEPMSEENGPDFRLIELLFFAYRDFVADADAVLEDYGFGRAHHRVLHFVNRRPGMTVADLLEFLNITKQSLGRVLRQLLESGHIVQITGPSDRRQRLLYPTEKGRNLALLLSGVQNERIGKALAATNDDDQKAIREFLFEMVNGGGRTLLEGLGSASEQSD
ncbi:MAG: MarR family transcriptional regulator [Pseudomonadota bacterium]